MPPTDAMAQPQQTVPTPDLDISAKREPEHADSTPVPSPMEEPMAPASRPSARRSRGARLAIEIATSAGIHAAILALFLLGPGRHIGATLLSGMKSQGMVVNGDAQVNSMQGARAAPQPDVVSVTLTPPPPAPQPKPKPATPPKALPPKTPAPRPAPAAEQARPSPPVAAPQPRQPQIVTSRATSPAAVRPIKPEKPSPQRADNDPKPSIDGAAAAKPQPLEPSRPPSVERQQEAAQLQAEREEQAATTKPTPAAKPSKPAPSPKDALTFQQPFLLPGSGALTSRQGKLTATPVEDAKAEKSDGEAKKDAGDAAVSNYPGRIARKLNRSLRYPAGPAAAHLRGDATVTFTIASNGKASGIGLVRSSGSDQLDEAAIETVKRASPFPAIPAKAGRHEWPFTVTLAFGN